MIKAHLEGGPRDGQVMDVPGGKAVRAPLWEDLGYEYKFERALSLEEAVYVWAQKAATQ